jgi:hypothetical protein
MHGKFTMCALAVLGTSLWHAHASAQSVLFNPKVVNSSVVATGVESRLRFHLKQWDSSVTGQMNEGVIGPTANISNNAATLLNTVYDFRLDFEAASGQLTWTISGGALTSPSVLVAFENDAFNAIRFNARTTNAAHTLTFSDLAFDGLPGTGTLRSSGAVSNRIDSQRVVADVGLSLSDFDWSMSGRVSTDGTSNSNTKIWIASHQLDLDPRYSPPMATLRSGGAMATLAPVPEPSAAALSLSGVVLLLALMRVRRKRAADARAAA